MTLEPFHWCITVRFRTNIFLQTSPEVNMEQLSFVVSSKLKLRAEEQVDRGQETLLATLLLLLVVSLWAVLATLGIFETEDADYFAHWKRTEEKKNLKSF